MLPTAQPPVVPAKLQSINALRGAAALAVVFFHALMYSNPPLEQPLWFRIIFNILHQGYLGVPLFFVISGFCIHMRWVRQYVKTRKTELSFMDFWKRRFHRLYPPYFVMLCGCMAMTLLLYLRGIHYFPNDRYPEPKLEWMALDFGAHLFMMHGLHPVLDLAGGNLPFWTLAREEYLYMMYFLLVGWRLSIGPRRTLGLVWALGTIVPWGLTSGARWLAGGAGWSAAATYLFNPTNSALALWIQWCLGMVAVEACYGLIKLPRWCYWISLVPLWFAAGKLSELYCPVLSPVLWGMTFFTLVNYCVKREISLPWPDHAVVAWLAPMGIFSYSLYLTHIPSIYVTKTVLSLRPNGSPALYLLHVCILACAACGGGFLFFTAVERRFLNTLPAVAATKQPCAVATPAQ